MSLRCKGASERNDEQEGWDGKRTVNIVFLKTNVLEVSELKASTGPSCLRGECSMTFFTFGPRVSAILAPIVMIGTSEHH